ncbi:MAG: DUF3734 domain-containing protein [Gammaproteobacteria bacterium]
MSVTRIVHTGEPGEGPSKDYEFSAETVEEHIEVGYIAACEVLEAIIPAALLFAGRPRAWRNLPVGGSGANP